MNRFSAPLTDDAFVAMRQYHEPFMMPMSKARHWTPDYLREIVPDHSVEVMAGRNDNPNYEMGCDAHRQQMSFHDYLDWIIANPMSNDIYLVANNQFLARTGQALVPELLSIGLGYTTEYNPSAMFFWLGSGGTITPLHHDPPDILFCQLYGAKRWMLYAPEESERLYPSVGVHASFNPFNPDYEKFPLAREAQSLDLMLEPGNALYIPSGWWHAVVAESTSISVSFTNLR